MQPAQADQRAPSRPVGQSAPNSGGERAPSRAVGHKRAGEAGNPFGDMAAKRQQALENLQAQRTGRPTGGEATPGQDVQDSPQAHRAPEGASNQAPPQSDPKSGDVALATLQKQFEEREARVRAAETQVREASTAAEKRAAEAEAREAKAEAKLKRLEMLRGDPIQFLVDAGIKEEEFKAYLASGGKQTSEQQRLSATEKQLQAMRDEMDKVRQEAAASIASLRHEREEAEFASELSKEDYALVREMGGVKAVRAKQAALRETLGKNVTLVEAAGQLENEWQHGFQELLKKSSIRSKLGLEVAAKAEEKSAKASNPSPRTMQGSLSSATTQDGERLAWDDWKGKKERILRDLARARRG